MKKSIICGAASLTFAATSIVNVFAVGVGTQTNDVTVGEVDETVYSVDINWGDMVFDWKYDYLYNGHSFESPTQCVEVVYNGEDIKASNATIIPASYMFSDNACSNPASDLTVGSTYYRQEHVSDQIEVIDRSENGAISVDASFTPESNYEWVDGRIGIYTKPSANSSYYNFTEYNDNQVWRSYSLISDDGDYLPAEAFYGYLALGTNDLYTKSTQANAGDKIGTITLTISPNTSPRLQ